MIKTSVSFEISMPGSITALAEISTVPSTTSTIVPIIRSLGKMPPTPEVQTMPPAVTEVEEGRLGIWQRPYSASPTVEVTKPRSLVLTS